MVRAWLHLPGRSRGTAADGRRISSGTAAVEAWPHERVLWAAAGYAHLVMDTRGQGSTWSVGDTPDRTRRARRPTPGS